jgi:DNA-binding MarR family transcriptional regulator
MVKSVDDNSATLIDHVGLLLWRAAHDWKSRMQEEMVGRGFPWHGEARGEVLAHVGPSGTSQAVLAERMGMTKQAVQQLVDQLVAERVVKRVPDADDGRAKRIELTALGRRDFAERNKVKRAIERRYRRTLGDNRFAQLQKALRMLTEEG